MNQLRHSISNYLHKKTFASFLPGIAGLSGIPMWCFYVNRGQAIASFGIENKNKSIMEFFPANKSYEYVSSHGFRTFVKIDGTVYEPFTLSVANDSEQHMYIHANGLHIEDINHTHNLKIKVSYFILPNEDFGAFVRGVSVSNLGDKRDIEIIDGMPEVIPMGIGSERMKNMGYTARAWADVVYAEESIPVYTTRSLVGDEEVVETMHDGIFFVNFYKDARNSNLILDRSVIFEYYDSLSTPVGFLHQSITELMKKPQYVQNNYSSAFAGVQETLNNTGEQGDTLSFQSYFGYVARREHLSTIARYMDGQKQTSYINKKIDQAEHVIEDITKDIATVSAYPEFDNYCKQSYMDNVIRGGYPLVFPNKDGYIVYYVYGRKHGDLERDYNFFHLEAQPFSQGNGNFRDICQNRRNDVVFHPQIKDDSIKTFVGLLQADGYNPLVVEGIMLSVEQKYFSRIEDECKIHMTADLKTLLQKFSLGDIAEYLRTQKHGDSDMDLISIVLKYADYQNLATFGEGYWIDHFCYILDMIESYEEVYPENITELLYNTYCSYFDSPARVQSRDKKYTVLDSRGDAQNTQKKRVIQKTAIKRLAEKQREQAERKHPFLITEHGDIYYGSVFEKLLCMVSNKISALDPNGMGIEMEASKPGWNDALNGMPGILGSGISEVFEVLRVVDFLHAQVPHTSVELNERVFRFSDELHQIYTQQYSDFQRWDEASTTREQFRDDVYAFMPSKKIEVSPSQIHNILSSYTKVLRRAIDTVSNVQKDILPSFIHNIAVDFEQIPSDGDAVVKTRAFEYRCLPTFLEAPTKSMYVRDKESARALYKQIKKSDLYDPILKMYKTSESLESESHLIGRARSFTPGWLERESIFLHMEFKYMLSLLKKGLYSEYYEELHAILPCFMDEERYGRSILEASSFIVSSVNNNTSLHGRGYSARLSGAHAEFLSMWKIMFLGERLFRYHDGVLHFTLSPRLPHTYFGENGTITTTLFSLIQVIIHNPSKKDTFAILPNRIICDNEEHEGHTVSGETAYRIRDRKIKKIQIFY